MTRYTCQKKAGVAILILDKIDFIEISHFMMTKGSIHQEDIKILNIYVLNRSLKYMKQKQVKQQRETDKSTIMVGSFNTLPSIIDRTRRSNPLQYSCLKNPMDRGAWWATALEVTRQIQLSD